jgi:hypothetical protein
VTSTSARIRAFYCRGLKRFSAGTEEKKLVCLPRSAGRGGGFAARLQPRGALFCALSIAANAVPRALEAKPFSARESLEDNVQAYRPTRLVGDFTAQMLNIPRV